MPEAESTDASTQSHPLEASDRDHLDRLLARDSPQDGDLADLARVHTTTTGILFSSTYTELKYVILKYDLKYITDSTKVVGDLLGTLL